MRPTGCTPLVALLARRGRDGWKPNFPVMGTPASHMDWLKKTLERSLAKGDAVAK